jgi:CheY-like chemotaxis protein
MTAGGGHSLLLRCELTLGERRIMTHTIEVGATFVRIACSPQPAVGEEARVVLSLPGLVPRLYLSCRVTALEAPDKVGHGPAIVCHIIEASSEAREALAELAAGRALVGREKYRCLLVEDNAFIRDLFSYGVQRYGRDRKRPITVEVAEDADSGWRMLESGDFDMAIVDHYLPTGTGADLIARIRGDARLLHMSVVAISVGGHEVRDATMAAGADLFLDKPIVMRDLFATLDTLVSKHASAAAEP